MNHGSIKLAIKLALAERKGIYIKKKFTQLDTKSFRKKIPFLIPKFAYLIKIITLSSLNFKSSLTHTPQVNKNDN